MDEQQGASKTQALQVEGTIGEDEMEMCYAFFKMNDSDDDKMEEVTPILVNSATTTHSFSSLFAMGDKQEQDLLVDDFEPIRFVYEQEQQCRAWWGRSLLSPQQLSPPRHLKTRKASASHKVHRAVDLAEVVVARSQEGGRSDYHHQRGRVHFQ